MLRICAASTTQNSANMETLLLLTRRSRYVKWMVANAVIIVKVIAKRIIGKLHPYTKRSVQLEIVPESSTAKAIVRNITVDSLIMETRCSYQGLSAEKGILMLMGIARSG